jgi:lysophospholipase L1-like esterase
MPLLAFAFSLAATTVSVAVPVLPAWDDAPPPAIVRGTDWNETVRLSFPKRVVPLRNLHLAGPFVAEDGQNFATEFWPEKAPLDLSRWQPAPAAWSDANARHDLLIFDRKENAAAYIYGEFETKEAEDLIAVGGSDDTFTLWVNGSKLVAHEVYRAAGPDEEHVSFRSVAGKNALLLKVCQGGLGWAFYLDVRRPFTQSPPARARELAALMQAHPEDEAHGWVAALEIADILRAEGDRATADQVVDRFTEGLPAESWPAPGPLLLKPSDHFVIAGDSITQQRLYTRVMEDYLRASQPGLVADIRQQGWSGEQTSDLLKRMDTDLLPFRPTVVLDAYGFNDTLWGNYTPAATDAYGKNTAELARRLKAAGVRLVVSGTTSVVPSTDWHQDVRVGPHTTNHNLAELNARGAEVAKTADVSYIELFAGMLHAGAEGLRRHGSNFRLSGDDGVHPDRSGQLVIATARLMGLGIDGDLGGFELDLRRGKASVEGKGHALVSSGKGWARIRSTRYPFCIGAGAADDPRTWAAGARLAPFHERLNRLMLTVRHAGTHRFRLHWGDHEKTVDGHNLEKGVNLAALFEDANPFSAAFSAVDEAVARKQEFETHELQEVLHGPLQGEALKEAVAAAEEERARLIKAIEDARVPVEHEIRVESIP